MEAKFLLKKPNGKGTTLISMYFRFNGRRLVYSTGIKVKPSDWISDKQRCVKNKDFREGNIINNNLEKLSNTIKSVYLEVTYPGLTVQEFKKHFLKALGEGEEEEEGEVSFMEYFEKFRLWFYSILLHLKPLIGKVYPIPLKKGRFQKLLFDLL